MSERDALIGRTFGRRFTLTTLLAEGSMGAVFRGRERGGAVEVAVKVLLPRLASDPAACARFEHEARMAAHVDHPNAVRVLAHGMEAGVPYLVMELVEGRELFDVLAEAGRFAPSRAVAILLQICDALSTAHDAGIIHRDVKPENVMLSGDPSSPGGERVKLLDFGVAKQLESTPGEGEEDVTVVGTILGTPGYMAPEQCLGHTVDARSDVYSCGALLYHLVTGRPPFEDLNPFVTLARQINEAPRPPSTMVPGLDRALEVTILKALAKRPEDRHQSAVELWEELLAERPVPPSAGPRERPRLLPRAPRAVRGAALVAALAALPACGREPVDATPAATTRPAASAQEIKTPFCGPGWRALDHDTCVALPERFSPPASLVVFAHGILAAGALPAEEQATLLAAAQAHGFAVLFARGKVGLCDWEPKVATSYCWPTKQKTVDEAGPEILAEWTVAQRRAEEIAGERFQRRYLFGFSNGGYFVAHLVVEGRFPVDGAGVVGAGRTAIDESLSGPGRLPLYLAVGDQEAPATRQDAANLAHVLALRGWPLRYVVHPGRAHELHEDDLGSAWAAWGRDAEIAGP
jgi:serine/threonine protein kinase/predicted esterase